MGIFLIPGGAAAALEQHAPQPGGLLRRVADTPLLEWARIRAEVFQELAMYLAMPGILSPTLGTFVFSAEARQRPTYPPYVQPIPPTKRRRRMR